MHLTLCLPGLIWPHTAATGQSPKNLPTQVLDSWLRFGNISSEPRTRSDLYRLHQSYNSLLAHAKHALGISASQHAFLVSPVLQRVDMHSMSLTDGSNLNITMSEAKQMCDDINVFIDDTGYVFVPYREYLWLVTSTRPVTWYLPPVCDIEGQLKFMPRPQSEQPKESAKLQTLQAELQMFLSQHPVNQQRRQSKQVEINGLWFWRDLETNTPQNPDMALMTDAPLLQNSATKQTDAPYDWAAAATWLQEQGAPEQAILWLNTLEAPTLFGDIWGYQDEFAALNERFFKPIQDAIQQGHISQLTIQTDGEHGLDVAYHKRQRLAFWKRQPSLNDYFLLPEAQ